jgi:hypothetical protein
MVAITAVVNAGCVPGQPCRRWAPVAGGNWRSYLAVHSLPLLGIGIASAALLRVKRAMVVNCQPRWSCRAGPI